MNNENQETVGATCEKSSQVDRKSMTLDEAIAHAEKAVNDTPCGQEHKQLADWLKELREIKNSNVAAMREALVKADVAFRFISKSAWFIDANFSETKEVMEACNAISAALSAPPRNCDVGTAKEQCDRLEAFCRKHYRYAVDNPCAGCPIDKDGDSKPCVYRFLQMSYDETK